jgi:hypothetical protein
MELLNIILKHTHSRLRERAVYNLRVSVKKKKLKNIYRLHILLKIRALFQINSVKTEWERSVKNSYISTTHTKMTMPSVATPARELLRLRYKI